MKFKVGDVCEIIKSPNFPEYVGRECTIVELRQGISRQGNPYDCLVEVPGAYSQFHPKGYRVSPFAWLRKKPPREDLKVVSWDDCDWRPSKEKA